MEPDLQAIIRRALADAQAAGTDYLTQTEETVRAVLQAFPDMTASDALVQVSRFRRLQGAKSDLMGRMLVALLWECAERSDAP